MGKNKNTTTYNKNITDHSGHSAKQERLIPDVRKSFEGADFVDATQNSQKLNRGAKPTSPPSFDDDSLELDKP